jgi:hypothetical protein
MSAGIEQKPRTVWICFDIDNGDYPIKNYGRWFETLEDARDYRIDQMAVPNSARLSQPVKYTIADGIEEWP